MIAGILLTETEQKSTELAFLDEELKTFSCTENSEIVEKIEEFEPEVVAVDSAAESAREELSEDEEELKEEGYSFTPSRTESKKVRRFQALKAELRHQMDEKPKFIRFDQYITAEELAIDGDEAFRSYGIDPSDIDSARQFDAVLGAVTARFYQQDQFRDLGVIVPESLDSE